MASESAVQVWKRSSHIFSNNMVFDPLLMHHIKTAIFDGCEDSTVVITSEGFGSDPLVVNARTAQGGQSSVGPC